MKYIPVYLMGSDCYVGVTETSTTNQLQDTNTNMAWKRQNQKDFIYIGGNLKTIVYIQTIEVHNCC